MEGGGDLGRRLCERRKELGLSLQEVADRSSVDANYLSTLERRPWSEVSPSALSRLASALGTTVGALSGGGTQAPPGQATPDAGAPLTELTPRECRDLLGTGGVGRIVFLDERGPVAIPVNFTMDGDDVVFRTERGSAVARLHPEETVSFEVDNVDDPLAEGWSVLLTGGWAREGAGEAPSAVDVQPWAAGNRDWVVRIRPSLVTGRRIRRVPGHP